MKKFLKLIITLFIVGTIFIIISENSIFLGKGNKDNSINKENNNNKSLSDEEKKLNELENINKKIDYFNMSYLDRYLVYKRNH